LATNSSILIVVQSGRLPYLGVPVSTEGQEHVHSVVGPMTRTLSTLTTIAKAVVDAQPWRIDPRCHQLPWRQELYDEVQTRPLVVGLLVDDGVVKIHPPLKRALLELNTKLKAAGHEVIPWNVEGHAEVVDVLVCTLSY
jgi:amidase